MLDQYLHNEGNTWRTRIPQSLLTSCQAQGGARGTAMQHSMCALSALMQQHASLQALYPDLPLLFLPHVYCGSSWGVRAKCSCRGKGLAIMNHHSSAPRSAALSSCCEPCYLTKQTGRRAQEHPLQASVLAAASTRCPCTHSLGAQGVKVAGGMLQAPWLLGWGMGDALCHCCWPRKGRKLVKRCLAYLDPGWGRWGAYWS